MTEKLSCQCFVVYLQLVVLRSAFRVPRSAFRVPRSAFRVPCYVYRVLYSLFKCNSLIN